MRRRQFLSGLGASLAGLGLAWPVRVSPGAAPNRAGVLYVPGYDSASALAGGRPVVEHGRFARAVPRGYDGPVTLLTRLDLENGAVRRAAYPLQGHAVALAPSGEIGAFASIRDHRMIAFEARSLDVVAVSKPFAKGFTGGGHCRFLPESGLLLVSERAPYRPYSGRREAHHGRLTLRDPLSLQVVESYSCHGIHPHDLRFLEGGRVVAVANYGSTRNQDLAAVVPDIVEPSITVIEVASGKLLDKVVVPPRGAETRHLAPAGNDALFVVQVAKGEADAPTPWAQETVAERDRLSQMGEVYLPAPLLRISRRQGEAVPLARGAEATFMRHGLSIVHEPVHHQIIASFPGSHTVMVADAESGAITRVLRTDRLGLRYPCGVALHPDGQRFIVTGSFENVYLFDRASHRLDRGACHYLPLFRHSHVVAA